jgi:hypothetical protein
VSVEVVERRLIETEEDFVFGAPRDRRGVTLSSQKRLFFSSLRNDRLEPPRNAERVVAPDGTTDE